MKFGTAYVEIRPDLSRFGQELNRNITQEAKKAELGLRDLFAGGAFLAGANRAQKAASDLQQAVGGTAAVFGQASRSVDQFAKTPTRPPV